MDDLTKTRREVALDEAVRVLRSIFCARPARGQQTEGLQGSALPQEAQAAGAAGLEREEPRLLPGPLRVREGVAAAANDTRRDPLPQAGRGVRSEAPGIDCGRDTRRDPAAKA